MRMITVGLSILAPSIVSSPSGVNYLAYQHTVIERASDDDRSFDDECNGVGCPKPTSDQPKFSNCN